MVLEIEKFTQDIIQKIQEQENSKRRELDMDYSPLPGGYTGYGLRTPVVREISKEFYKQLKSSGVTEIDDLLNYCNFFLTKRITELRHMAFDWSYKLKRHFEPRHFDVFESWLKNYVTGWGSTDHLCIQSLGYLLHMYPELVERVKKWTSSNNLWVKRASAVSLIYGLRRGVFLKDAFEIADDLLHDQEMYVQKGYGWMLKEASKLYRAEVFNYVIKHKDTMPRLSLRYAIEKMPEEMRKEAMQS